MNEGDSDTTSLRRQLKSLMAEAAKNETILHRAQERELKLLRSGSIEQLFDNMVDGLQASFGLDAVTIALADPEHEIHHLLLFGQREDKTYPGVLLVDSLESLSPAYARLGQTALGPFVADQHAMLFPDANNVRSVALLPLEKRSRLVGCLNFGSSDAHRFTRHHATDFLEHLGAIAGFCLENAINRSRLVWSGLTDVLTGWHNRRYLNSRLPEEVARAKRLGSPLSCLIFDLDYFKRVNDEYGHLAGDAALREVARRAQKSIRASDVAARFGGEEFVVLMPDTGIDDACVLAERLRLAIGESPVRVTEKDASTVTVSLGVAELTMDAVSDDLRIAGERLLGRADAALYAAKEAGRNRLERAEEVETATC